MTEIHSEPKSQDHDTREAAALERERAAAKNREHRRAEREREAYKSHYLGAPQKPR